MSEDLFGSNPMSENKIDILALREMKSCKAKNEILEKLHKQAETFVIENMDECIYIRSNVSSSKNSKQIAKFKKRNEKTGKLEDFYTLTNSDTVKQYIKETKQQWITNLFDFKKITEGLKMPLVIEFTFVRDSLRRFDCHNAVQLVADLMVENKYIIDDESCYLIPVFNHTVFYSKKYAGVLIKVIGGNKKPIAF